MAAPAGGSASRIPPGTGAVKREGEVGGAPSHRRIARHPGAGCANIRLAGGKVTSVNEPDRVGVLIQRLDPGLPLPERAHPGDAGADLYAAADVELAPGQRAVVPTGIAIALPDGYAAFVHPRSGLAARHGVTIVNAPGTVDAGYRGEIRVTLLNTDAETPVRFQRGDRIAQLVVQRVERPVFHEVDRLPGSARGEGGFGSTGGHAAAATPAG
jgi:dUTP pyrophosphatase